MVWHEQEYIRPPFQLFLPMTNSFKQTSSDFRQRELIPGALAAVDRNEINRLLWINPGRNFMGQRFALRQFHARMLKSRALVGKSLARNLAALAPLVGTARRSARDDRDQKSDSAAR